MTAQGYVKKRRKLIGGRLKGSFLHLTKKYKKNMESRRTFSKSPFKKMGISKYIQHNQTGNITAISVRPLTPQKPTISR